MALLKNTFFLTSAAKTISTAEPEVKDVSVRNADTMTTDKYIEYLVKTNTAATELKAYPLAAGSEQKSIATECNHIFTKIDDTMSFSYGSYNSSYSYKMWSIKIPLSSNKVQPVTLVAADDIGDGTVTKTPATGFAFNTTRTFYDFYAGDTNTKTLSNLYKFEPLDENGNSLADCCKSVTYSISNSTYCSISGTKLTADITGCLTDLESLTTSYKRATVTFKLNNYFSATKSFDINKPKVSEVSYDTERSVLRKGGTVYFTAKTYGSDTIYVRNANDKYSAVVLSLNKTDNPDCYTEETDTYGNVYTLWNFERQFDYSDNKKMETYVRSSYKLSDTVTSNSSSYSSKILTRENDPGDYTAWDAQTNRIDEQTLASLSALYGEDSTLYAQRLADYQNDEEQQELIDAQTQALTEVIDILLGYSDYDQALNAYFAFEESENAGYITPALQTLVETPVNDTNCKALSNEISAELAAIEAFIDLKATVAEYLTAVENELPEG